MLRRIADRGLEPEGSAGPVWGRGWWAPTAPDPAYAVDVLLCAMVRGSSPKPASGRLPEPAGIPEGREQSELYRVTR
jgi:hypothetical protein